MAASPLRDEDFRRANQIRQHLLSLQSPSAHDIHQVSDSLAELIGSDDVSVAITDPSQGPAGLSLWFREFRPEQLREIARATDGHAPFRYIRSRGMRTISFEQADRGAGRPIRSTEFFRRFEAESGLHHGLVSHLGTQKGESLGRIVFYREKDRSDYDEERVRLLEILRPEFSQAARRVISSRLADADAEVAFVNAGGQILWMSDGFRFLWNTVDPLRIDYGRLGFREMLQGSDLGRRVAFHVINLEGPAANYEPPRQVVVPFRGDARGGIAATFDTISDQLMGCRGDVLKVSLRRLPAPRSRPTRGER